MSARRVGIEELLARAAELPERIRSARLDPPTGLRRPPTRGVVATGVGSSAAHARILASVLCESGPRPGRFVPVEALAERPPAGSARDALVVFSQGLCPNARLAIAQAGAWAHTIAVTSAAAIPARRDALPALEAAGVEIRDPGAGEEFGTLLRITGPMLGSLAALALARELGAPIALDRDAAASAAARAFEAGREAGRELGSGLGDLTLSIVTTGWHAERCDNLRLKLVEGLLVPVPPVSDALDLAHGALQALHAAPAIVLAPLPASRLAREALDRVAACLEPSRHRLLRHDATLPGPAAILEHEAWMNGIVLELMRARRGDPAQWPGRGRDAAIYERGEHALPAPAAAKPRPALTEQRWPELGRALEHEAGVAILPLGSTEQHGPHLPFATDTAIADALARRLAARVPGAVALPPLALGCASEHMSFPGTLSLERDTLVAVLGDVLTSLARHGFAEAFVFSAHGGNLDALRGAADALARRAHPMRLLVLDDHAALNARLVRVATDRGVSAEAAGQHAGELETSILLHLAPELVRDDAFGPGRMDPTPSGHTLFHPDLRRNAPNGVVGDPRAAEPARGAAYLEAWVDELEAFRRASQARARHQTKGTKSA